MTSIRVEFLIAVFLTALSPGIEAQQHHARSWNCVRQPFVEETDGNVMFLQCSTALPDGEKLDAQDEENLTKLEIIRYNASTFKLLPRQDPKHWSSTDPKGLELQNSLRMGFGQKVGQLCQKHPDIVLASLFPDSGTSTITLYGCNNIIAAPEK